MSIMDYSAAIINHALEDHLIKYENVLIVLLSESDSKTNMYRMKQYKGGDVHVTRVPNPQAKDGQQTPEAARRILP